jgi:membrane-associated phospholipid phosphatase
LRPAAVAGALAFGAAVGALRMAFGGHYLSDVLGAALIALAFVAAIRRILLRPRS